MRLGILTIGSLWWETECQLRREWHDTRLVRENAVHVKAPIRYGRRSSRRKNTFTMVFSPDLDPEQYGVALAVPTRKQVVEPSDLVEEAEALWAAESKSSFSQGISADWGAVGLLINPDSNVQDAARFLDVWKQRVVSEGANYTSFPVTHACSSAVTSDGLLAIPWPQRVDGEAIEFDLLLGTATHPTFTESGYYFDASEIGSAMLASGYEHYFRSNRDAGITTFEDDDVLENIGRVS